MNELSIINGSVRLAYEKETRVYTVSSVQNTSSDYQRLTIKECLSQQMDS